ncbi:hypothetical protein VTJ04DRAFT_4520 [Mycothermus thermophilus]|uniref:uncharacterized protein n=1 Tax=Humicola insolens TaxID=85995 RepID=UPI0037421E86
MPAPSRREYSNVPAVEIEDDDDDGDLIDPDDADLNTFDDPLAQASSSSSARNQQQQLHGNISSSSSATTNQNQSWTSRLTSGGEYRAAPRSTIDESVWATLRRDLLAIWRKLLAVLYPRHLFAAWTSGDGSIRGAYATLRAGGLAGARELAGRVLDAESLLRGGEQGGGSVEEGASTPAGQIRDWDLWGPLVFCLLLSTLLCLKSREQQREVVFSGVFALVWIGMAVVTVQIKLLGGNISFAQSICVIGYTLFPLVIAALLSALSLHWIARIPVYIFLILWSLAAGVSILSGSGVVKNRVGLAVYPLFIFYVGLGCLCFIS